MAYRGRSGSGRGGYPKPVTGTRRSSPKRKPRVGGTTRPNPQAAYRAPGHPGFMGPQPLTTAAGWEEHARGARQRLLRQLLIDTAKKNAGADPTAPTDGSGGGYGGGGGGYGGPSTAQVNADYMGQVAQVNQIGADQAARLKAIQDAYNAQAQAAVAGIKNDTTQLQGQFNGEMAGLKRDLAGQGVQANPVTAAGTVQQQALRDAQLRGSTFAQQLQLAQNANFADRAAGAASMQQGFLTDLATQRQAALSGGGGGGGGGGYGGGGSGSDMPDYLKTRNLNSDLILGDKLAGEESTYRNWLRQQGHGAFHGRPLLQATLKDLRGGIAPDSLLARTNPNRRRVVGFLKQASKQYGGTRKASAKRRLRAAQRAKAAY